MDLLVSIILVWVGFVIPFVMFPPRREFKTKKDGAPNDYWSKEYWS